MTQKYFQFPKLKSIEDTEMQEYHQMLIPILKDEIKVIEMKFVHFNFSSVVSCPLKYQVGELLRFIKDEIRSNSKQHQIRTK